MDKIIRFGLLVKRQSKAGEYEAIRKTASE